MISDRTRGEIKLWLFEAGLFAAWGVMGWLLDYRMLTEPWWWAPMLVALLVGTVSKSEND